MSELFRLAVMESGRLLVFFDLCKFVAFDGEVEETLTTVWCLVWDCGAAAHT